MNTSSILILVNGLLSIAFNLWSTLRKVEGIESIPSWEELVAKNSILQNKIDTEKE
ncbi:MAG: hypothetical protein K6T87_15945 [Roseiflexus sp.]|uniref:hypothetical protein n=1 Tax=Roseiflexus sp. TaxID=2562120 RepID=UPI0025F9D8F7|nr:hypothetical protein [Roseiflexus sp.]MCL6542048.1 hypothetical protein [Roseiflexus sp.]